MKTVLDCHWYDGRWVRRGERGRERRGGGDGGGMRIVVVCRRSDGRWGRRGEDGGGIGVSWIVVGTMGDEG